MNLKKTAFNLALILLIIVGAGNKQPAYAEGAVPLFKYESTQTFHPDVMTRAIDNSRTVPDEERKTISAKKEDADLNSIPIQFQLADPKGIQVAPYKAPESDEDEKLKISPTQDKKEEIKTTEDNNVEESIEEKKETAEEIKEETPKKKDKKKKDKKKDKADKKDKDKHEEKTEEHKDDISFTKEDLKDSISDNKEDIEVEQVDVTVNEEDSDKTEKLTVIEESDKLEKDENSDGIDYYLKKYSSTLEAEASVNEFKHSLDDPFKQSLFYDVLKDNKYETIQIKTSDVTANFKPEAVVSYNVPLGAEGEYACQLMVLKTIDKGLDKMWVSELIPGEIDTVMIQDVNNDAQNDIVSVSTTGGVSLLKSIRVYTYDKAKNTFHTIFAMNGIMEGIVNVTPGKILISETFPGGINRAALYVWNGRRFERLEL